jgi:hypothetical protein
MTRKPSDKTPKPPGGRAAERLREFLDQRYPGGLPPEASPLPEDTCEEAVEAEEDAETSSKERSEQAVEGDARRATERKGRTKPGENRDTNR